MKIYAGIGSRKTPNEVLLKMTLLAILLEKHGYVLRSGGANGADMAFENGVDNNKEIYLPWKGFNNNKSKLYGITNKIAFDIAEKNHPAWNRCSFSVRQLLARNVYQILGNDCKTPCNFVVCWTKDGKDCGGTGTAIRIARSNGIQVFNLFNIDIDDVIMRVIY